MASRITFSAGSNSVTVNTPQWGYQTDIIMPFVYSRHKGQADGIYDKGAARDVRVCKCKFLLSLTDHDGFQEAFQDPTLLRGQSISLNLGTDSGFYPFGPDYGDSGVFVCTVVDFVPSGQLLSPWKYWATEVTLVYTSGPTPSYSLPAEVTDGGFQVGTITGLRFPQTSFPAYTRYDVSYTTVFGGAGYVRDGGTTADDYTSTVNFTGNQTKAAALVDYLTGTARANNFSIVTEADNYIFGYDKGDSDTYTVQLLTPTLEVMHDFYDHFSASFNVKWVA